MSDTPEVIGIHYGDKVAVLDCNCIVPVTHWFDWQGFDCEPDDAETCVCGDEDHGWFVVELDQLEPVMVQ